MGGVREGEGKGKIMGKGFMEVLDEEGDKIEDVKWVGEGSMYGEWME